LIVFLHSSCDLSRSTVIYTLSLHDALPIYPQASSFLSHEQVKTRLHASMQRWITGVFSLHQEQSLEAVVAQQVKIGEVHARVSIDRKSTRLNSSHVKISYAVFCVKKKTKQL